MKKYRYIGDRMTDPKLKGQTCEAITRPDGKCIRGKNGNMLVSFHGVPTVVIGRLLRKETAHKGSPFAFDELLKRVDIHELGYPTP